MASEFQNNFEGYNKELIRKVSQFQEWLALKFDYKMTIDAENVTLPSGHMSLILLEALLIF